MLDFVIQCITFVLRGTTVWRRRSWRSRACSDAKTSAEAKKVDIEGYISPRVRVVRIGSGRSVDRLKVEPLWKEMSKNSCCWPPGDRARERRSSGGGHGCSWCRDLAHTARGCLPAPRVSAEGVLRRRWLALCLRAHACSLDVPLRHSSQSWLGLVDEEPSRDARSVARMPCARSCA